MKAKKLTSKQIKELEKLLKSGNVTENDVTSLFSKSIISHKSKKVNSIKKEVSKNNDLVSDYIKVKGSSGRYTNTKTGETISRRQYMKRFKPIQYNNLLKADLIEHKVKYQSKTELIKKAKTFIKSSGKTKKSKTRINKHFPISTLHNKKQEALLKNDSYMLSMVDYLYHCFIPLDEIKEGLTYVIGRIERDKIDKDVKNHYDVIFFDYMFVHFEDVKICYAKDPLYLSTVLENYGYPELSVLGESK